MSDAAKNRQGEPRSVQLRRTDSTVFEATNVRGGTISIGAGDTDLFTPVELLLASISACSGIDVDMLTSRRAEPSDFQIECTATRVRDEQGNHLRDIDVKFTVSFPDGDDGDRARTMLPRAIEVSNDRLCTVSRTVALSSPVHMHAGDAS